MMSVWERLQSVAAWIACCGMLSPAVTFADVDSGTADPTPFAVRDVALPANGELHGHLVDADGRALPSTAVVLRRDRQEVARTITNQSGLL